MTDSEGVRLVFSPVQLAAVLTGESISEGETLSNRLWAAWVYSVAWSRFLAQALCAWLLTPQCLPKPVA